MSKWRWIMHEGQTLYDIGILEDGQVHNPNGYPEDLVREAIEGATERRHARRSEAAKRAAVTRRERQEKRVYETAKRLLDGGVLEPRCRCRICGKGLDDRDSIRRGIGSDCWQGVLRAMSKNKENMKMSDELQDIPAVTSVRLTRDQTIEALDHMRGQRVEVSTLLGMLCTGVTGELVGPNPTEEELAKGPDCWQYYEVRGDGGQGGTLMGYEIVGGKLAEGLGLELISEFDHDSVWIRLKDDEITKPAA